MKPMLWEIWRDEIETPHPWCLQGPNAVLHFKTREEAEKYRDVTKAYLTKKGIK